LYCKSKLSGYFIPVYVKLLISIPDLLILKLVIAHPLPPAYSPRFTRTAILGKPHDTNGGSFQPPGIIPDLKRPVREVFTE